MTLDGGRSFRHDRIPSLAGYMAKTIRVTGREVVVAATRGTLTRTATVDVP